MLQVGRILLGAHFRRAPLRRRELHERIHVQLVSNKNHTKTKKGNGTHFIYLVSAGSATTTRTPTTSCSGSTTSCSMPSALGTRSGCSATSRRETTTAWEHGGGNSPGLLQQPTLFYCTYFSNFLIVNFYRGVEVKTDILYSFNLYFLQKQDH